MPNCNSRNPDGVLRCELDKGHDWNGEDHACAIRGASGIIRVTWASRRGEKTARMTRSRMQRIETNKQAYRQGRLAGIRDERLSKQQEAYDDQLRGLGPGWANVPGPSWCEHCLKATPAENLQLHHYTQRSLGERATPDNQGDERPNELALICQGPGSCHDQEHD